MYDNNREAYRKAFAESWQKYLKQLPLEPVEQQLVAIISEHPSYQRFLEEQAKGQTPQFETEENPYLHMSLHLAIREQIHLDLPRGIKAIYQSLAQEIETHEVEHRMMQALADFMWKAQQTGQAPDEADYLNALRVLV